MKPKAFRKWFKGQFGTLPMEFDELQKLMEQRVKIREDLDRIEFAIQWEHQIRKEWAACLYMKNALTKKK